MDDSLIPAGQDDARLESETVTLSRADYEALLDRLEDAEDLLAVRERELEEERLGVETVRAGYLTLAEAERVWAGEHPVRVHRERRHLTLAALAQRAGISPSQLSEIEDGREPGSLDAMARLARALGVPIEALVRDEIPAEQEVAARA